MTTATASLTPAFLASAPRGGRAATPDPDVALAARAAAGDARAFRQLVTLYRTRVYGMALRMLGDPAEAEDLAQDVFVTLFKTLKGFRAESRLSTWIYRVTRNHCLNRIKYLNRRGRQQQVSTGGEEARDPLAQVASGEPGPGRLVGAVEGTQRLAAALKELPVEQRDLVVLREVEGLSYEELMEITGLPEGTIKSRLHRARAALLKALPELVDGWSGGGRE